MKCRPIKPVVCGFEIGIMTYFHNDVILMQWGGFIGTNCR